MQSLERYEELYDLMKESRDPKKMRHFGRAERWAFEQMMNTNPSLAERWLEKLEPIDWNNYLSEDEAKDITSQIVNQDGKKGAMWNFSQVDNAVKNIGGKMECMPYYNPFALFTTMNMLVSDHLESLKEYVPDPDIPKVIYKMALEKLKDRDRPEFIREYYEI